MMFHNSSQQDKIDIDFKSRLIVYIDWTILMAQWSFEMPQSGPRHESIAANRL